MHYSQYRFTLDLQKHQSVMSVAVFQHDSAVKLTISLTDGGKPYFIEEGCSAVFYGKRADDVPLCHDCSIHEQSEIIYKFEKSTTAALGTVKCEIRLYGKDGELITAPRFTILVEPRVVDDDEEIIEPEDERSALDRIFASETAREEAEEERERNFKAMYVRYSYYADGTDCTETYEDGMNYIGLASGKEAPEDKSGYTWCKFISDTKKFLNGEGGTLELEIEDSTIYYITGYETVAITTPNINCYTSHLFITFPDDAESVSLRCPSGMSQFGASTSSASPGDKWEISIDSVGGAVCAVHKGG